MLRRQFSVYLIKQGPKITRSAYSFLAHFNVRTCPSATTKSISTVRFTKRIIYCCTSSLIKTKIEDVSTCSNSSFRIRSGGIIVVKAVHRSVSIRPITSLSSPRFLNQPTTFTCRTISMSTFSFATTCSSTIMNVCPHRITIG